MPPSEAQNKDRDRYVYLFLAVYTFLLMFLCAGTSPFSDYPGTDSCVFFTIGRGMVHGKVPYRDLFDHKGWYIYFFNFLGALISESSTVGVFLVECCFTFLDALLCYRIFKAILSDKYKSLISVLIMLLIFFNYRTYQLGDLTETFALTFQLLSFYLIIRYYRSGSVTHPCRYMFLHGVCGGIALMLRANLVIMWGAVAIVMLTRLAMHREYKNALSNLFSGLAGLAAALAPPVLYALFTGSLRDMYEQSIVFNTVYSGKEGLFSKMIGTYGNPVGIAFLLGCILSCIAVYKRSSEPWMRSIFTLALLISLYGVSLSGRPYGHYFIYLIPLFIPFILTLTDYVLSKLPAPGHRILITMIILFFAATVILDIPVFLRLRLKLNCWYQYSALKTIAEEYRKIDQAKDTVLVHGESRYYTELDVIPETKVSGKDLTL